jgi:hypothetical protein
MRCMILGILRIEDGHYVPSTDNFEARDFWKIRRALNMPRSQCVAPYDMIEIRLDQMMTSREWGSVEITFSVFGRTCSRHVASSQKSKAVA